MRIIRRTFSNLSKSILLLGKAGEHLVTKLELDISKEIREFNNPSFELILKSPSAEEPYPVLTKLSENKLIYTFTENDLAEAGNGQIEALVIGSDGELQKSTTAKTVIYPSINPNTYPGPLQRFISELEYNVRDIVLQYNIEVVDALPSTAKTGKVIYLLGSGFYYYSNGQWNILAQSSSEGSNIVVVRSMSDFQDVEEGTVVLVPQQIEGEQVTLTAGIVEKTEQGFSTLSVLVSVEEKESYNDAASKKHTHGNKPALDKIGEYGGVLYFDGDPVVEPPDTLVPLSLGVTYDELFVRPDWQDVPVYIIGDNPVVCRLASDSTVGGFAESEIRLMYLVDYSTGMPCPALAVTSGGSYLTYFPVTYHAMGKTLAAGWYDVNDDPVQGTPTFTNMTFDRLVIGSDEPIRDLSGLSDEAQCALDTLSRMVNVSVEAMGTPGVKPDGVQRLTNAPIPGRRYAAVTNRNITFPLPAIAWTGAEQSFSVDLECTTAITLTLPSAITYADGKIPDTSAGTHTLRFFRPATSARWSVEEAKSYNPYDLPDQPISFATIDERTLETVLRAGHATANNEWAVSRDGVEQVWFNIGDTRQITLTDDREVTMRIIGMDFDDLQNGGKAALTCDFVKLLEASGKSPTANNNYSTSGFRSTAQNILSLFPDWLKNMVVPAVKIFDYANDQSVTDKVWLFSSAEVGLFTPDNVQNPAYPVFTNNVSRIRTKPDDTADFWGLRTIRTLSSTNSSFPVDFVSNTGGTTAGSLATIYDYMAVGFCLNVD